MVSIPSLVFGDGIMNKGLICVEDTDKNLNIGMYKGFWFVSNNTFEWWSYDQLDLNKNGDVYEFIIVFDETQTKVSKTKNYYFLRKTNLNGEIDADIFLRLDRYDLTLDHIVNNELVRNYYCEIYKKRSDFENDLQSILSSFHKDSPKI